MVGPVDQGLSPRALRAALIAAAIAALAVLAGVFGDVVGYVCLGVIVIVALLTAGERREAGGGWWMLLGVGAAFSVAGLVLAEASETLGGLVAVVGGALVVIGATVGFPAGDAQT